MPPPSAATSPCATLTSRYSCVKRSSPTSTVRAPTRTVSGQASGRRKRACADWRIRPARAGAPPRLAARAPRRAPGARPAEARLRGLEDRPRAVGLGLLPEADALQVLDARALEVAEEDDVVDVAEVIHVAPEHRQLHHH